MLSIKKRHELTRPITAGMIAFTVGLAGSVAYLNATTPLDNLVFNKQQNTRPTPQAETEAAAADQTTEGSTSDRNSDAAAQSVGGQSLPVSSWTPPATPEVSSAPAAQQTTVPVVEQQAPTIQTPAPPEDTAKPKPDPVSGLVDAVGNLLGL